jgi:hypothetical protein
MRRTDKTSKLGEKGAWMAFAASYEGFIYAVFGIGASHMGL